MVVQRLAIKREGGQITPFSVLPSNEMRKSPFPSKCKVRVCLEGGGIIVTESVFVNQLVSMCVSIATNDTWFPHWGTVATHTFCLCLWIFVHAHLKPGP